MHQQRHETAYELSNSGMSSRGIAGQRFDPGVTAWTAGLGKVRDAVRQQLVTRQLGAHLVDAPAPLRVLDVGCGQGTQAVALARAGHTVVGLDVSDELLDQARQAASAQGSDVAHRLSFQHGDLLDLGDEHLGLYDLVCCHGVAMYLPSLAETAAAVVSATRTGGLVSLLTRNRAGIAMRAGMAGNWAEAIAAFDATHYTNRLGIADVRADEPADVQSALAATGAQTIAWYGVRIFTDHWAAEEPSADFDALLAVEEQAGRRDPYRAIAALTHTISRRSVAPPPGQVS